MAMAMYILCSAQTKMKIPMTSAMTAIATMRDTNRIMIGIARSARPPGVNKGLDIVLRAIKAAARPDKHPAISDIKADVYQHEYTLSLAVGRR